MAGIDELFHDVLVQIGPSTEEKLREAARILEVTQEEVDKAASKGRGLKWLVIREFCSDELADSDDGGKAKMVQLMRLFGSKDEVGGSTGDSIKEEEQHGSETDEVPTVTDEIPTVTQATKSSLPSTTNVTDKLSFSSLGRQIEGGLRQEQSEEEIVGVVMQPISQDGLQLKSTLEGWKGLDVPSAIVQQTEPLQSSTSPLATPPPSPRQSTCTPEQPPNISTFSLPHPPQLPQKPPLSESPPPELKPSQPLASLSNERGSFNARSPSPLSPERQAIRNPPRNRHPPPVLMYSQLGNPQQWVPDASTVLHAAPTREGWYPRSGFPDGFRPGLNPFAAFYQLWTKITTPNHQSSERVPTTQPWMITTPPQQPYTRVPAT